MIKPYLKDAFDSLQLWVFSFIAVQLPVRIADELQQPLSLNVPQHRVLQSTAVFRQRLQAALPDPFLQTDTRRSMRTVSSRHWDSQVSNGTSLTESFFRNKMCRIPLLASLLIYPASASQDCQLKPSPADRSSSEHTWRTHPSWLFLWRHCACQICHRGQRDVTDPSLAAPHHLQKMKRLFSKIHRLNLRTS